MAVSTHSRPKAAGFIKHHMHIRCIGFNTQPPEGGWSWKNGCVPMSRVSTHSRPKAAGHCALFFMCLFRMFQHTAARRRLVSHQQPLPSYRQFQHTAARRRLEISQLKSQVEQMFQHTAARRRLVKTYKDMLELWLFQHTAARRRLVAINNGRGLR